MDVSVVREYLEAKKQRAKLESQFRRLESELAKAKTAESDLNSKIDPDGLITTETVKSINSLLTNRPLWLGKFPVSFAQASLKSSQLHMSIIFSQPLFEGWKTETPYGSWQSCPPALETPEPPDENHIAQYAQVLDLDTDAVCWEQNGNELRLLIDEKHGFVFRWEGE